MTMVCGAETTPEDEFIHNPDVQEFLDEQEHMFEATHASFRTRLEYFAWALKQKIEEEGW